MSKIIFNVFLILFILWIMKFKLKGEEYRKGRISSYVICSVLAFATIGKTFFYESVFYSIGLTVGISIMFGTLMYFAWQGRADRNKRRAFNFGIGVLIFIALIALVIASGINNVLFRG